MSDNDLSQLISKSLRHTLSKQESAQVDEHLKTSEESKKFAELSSLIQQSVSGRMDAAENSNRRLSDDMKARLKSSVAGALREKAALSRSGLISSTETDTSIRMSTHRESKVGTDEAKRQLVSRFRLIRRLGQGGLGNVWLARDEKLNRTVAIKEMRSEALASPTSWQRFHREAEITGHLEHPNVVPLYQFGVDSSSGEPFYAMRFVGKRTLADAIDEYHDRVEIGDAGALDLHRLLSVFLDICQAIAYAHSRGVIHRDLKPENVALDSFGQVIVLDWGLAKILEESELATKMTTSSQLTDVELAQTMQGDAVGTPLYMSPEQAAGDLDKVDEKTDVFGLGAILFAILTGNAPHENLLSSDKMQVDVILKKISEATAARAADYGKNVPIALERIFTKAMAHKRHLRYDSVQDLATAVESWIAGQSGKQAAYETLRMEGRELRADLESSVRDLERNVRFASGLPPIEELIHAETDEDIAAWRERLASIFGGLLRANPNYRNIVYASVKGDEFTELVHVERNKHDLYSIQNVPRSRLRSKKTNEYITAVANRKPGNSATALVCDPMCDRSEGCENSFGLLSGVPVYDPKTEEPFGVVLVNCDIDQMLRDQMKRRISASEVIVACDKYHVMMHRANGQINEETMGKPIKEAAPHFLPAIEKLQSELDFIDDTNANIYGARVWFIQNVHGLMYLLRRNGG